jgi:UDP:flavonoid glycosyltransferase YjiC (YdhE family)
MKLGIVLGTRADLPHAVALALAARRARHEVSIFAMDAGCAALAAEPAAARELLDADCELTACSNSAAGLELAEGIVRGSQDDHAAVIGTSDRLVALT